MKNKKFLGMLTASLLAGMLLLSSCGHQASGVLSDPIIDVSSDTEEEKDTQQTSIIDDIIIEDDTLPPQEGMVRSRLTNQWVAPSVAATRPIAVIVPNEAAAVPHYSLSKADILYEANVEGRMTRLMAIYEDWTNLNKIGNVRSLRTYYAYWAFEWDAFLVHYGGPFYVNDLLAMDDTQNVDGTIYANSPAFFKTSDRKEPHNTYTSGKDLLPIIAEKGYSLERRELADPQPWKFTTKSAPNSLIQYGSEAQTATYIDMSGCYPLTRCYFEYNPDDGLYYRSQHLSGGTDGPHSDADGTQLAFKNILIQNVSYEVLDDGYLVFLCHDTTQDGWFFTNGRGIHVTWEKTSDYGPTKYYDDNGNEIVLNAGKTMVCVVEDGDAFTFH